MPRPPPVAALGLGTWQFELLSPVLNGVLARYHRDGDTGSGRQGSLSDDVYELQFEDEHRAGRNGADATVTVAQLARHV